MNGESVKLSVTNCDRILNLYCALCCLDGTTENLQDCRLDIELLTRKQTSDNQRLEGARTHYNTGKGLIYFMSRTIPGSPHRERFICFYI